MNPASPKAALLCLAFALPTLGATPLWEPMAPLPVGNAGFLHGLMQGRVIVAGGAATIGGVRHGLDTVNAYDPAANSWKQIGTLPHPFYYGAFAAYDGSLFLIGGDDGAQTRADGWAIRWNGLGRKFGLLPHPVGYTGSAFHDSNCFILGGTANVRDLAHLSAAFLRLDLASGITTRLPDFPGGPTMQNALAANKTRLFVFPGGSFDAATHQLKGTQAAWCYLPAKDEWTQIAPYPFPVRAEVACLLDENDILLAGGTAPGGGANAACLLYDIGENRYLPLPNLPYAGTLMGLQKAGKSVYLMGGEDRPHHRADNVYRARIAELIEAAASTPAPGTQ